jgi:hypothetical protein
MARIIYFIASHVHPPQILRLMRALHEGSRDSRIVIHHDYKVSHLDPAQLRGYERVELAPMAVDVEWGGFSQIEMILQCLCWINERHEYDWLVYLSGQDYPVKPVSEIEQFLSDTHLDGFMQAGLIDSDWESQRRYLYHAYQLPHVFAATTAQNLLNRMVKISDQWSARPAPGRLPVAYRIFRGNEVVQIALRTLCTPFSANFTCRKGSSWWTLSRRSIDYAIAFVESHPSFVKYYRRVVFAANESFFQTILLNCPDLNICHDNNLRFILWEKWLIPGHPDLLAMEHYPRIKVSNRHFARKLDERLAPALLDRIDQDILHQN